MELPPDIRAKVDEIKARPDRQKPHRPAAPMAKRLAEAAASNRPVVSAREAEVIALVAEGMWNREIGAKLWISEETVKSHLRHAIFRTGSRNRTHLAVRFLRGEFDVLPARAI